MIKNDNVIDIKKNKSLSVRWVLTKILAVIGILILLSAYHIISKNGRNETVRFGICADVHREIMHDVDLRLRTFVEKMNEEEVDFIIQLGDFCQPQPHNLPFLDIWNRFDGPGYHVLGNHDMDNDLGDRFDIEEAVAYFGLPHRYYSFTKKGHHFIVLDGNDEDGEEQLAWLRQELAETTIPVILFAHQSVEWTMNIGDQVREVLEEANRNADKKKILAVFNAHHHIDHVSIVNGIYYVHVNSMTYHFVGRNHIVQERYGRYMDRRYHKIQETAPYKDPLYAIVTIEGDGTISIKGTQSEWVGPSPCEIGRTRVYTQPDGTRINLNEAGAIVPIIRDRVLSSLN